MNDRTLIQLIEWILFSHWVGDFVLQFQYMSTNKYKSPLVLLSHIGAYSATILIGVSLFMWTRVDGFGWIYAVLLFTAINGAAHFVIDMVTSIQTHELWKKKQTHDFFVMIGLDQFLHFLVFLATVGLLIPLS